MVQGKWSTTCNRMKLEHFLTPYTKINSKCIKDLNLRLETIKLLEENIAKTLSDINHSRILYDPPPRILEIKAKINKWDLLSCFSHVRLCVTPWTAAYQASLSMGFSRQEHWRDRKSTRLNSSHHSISYAVFCLKKKNRRACNATRRSLAHAERDVSGSTRRD